MSFRLSADQQHQIMSLDSIGAASLRRAIGWGITDMSVLCRHVWTDEAAFNGVCDALKKEALRAWLVRVSGVFPLVQWSMMKQTVWMCDSKDADLYAATRTYEQLEKLRNFVVEKMEHAPVPGPIVAKKEREAGVIVPEKRAARVPLPEAIRQTILCIKREPWLVLTYQDLCNLYKQQFADESTDLSEFPGEWNDVEFADQDALRRFQTYVDAGERLMLKSHISSAIKAYPQQTWLKFKNVAIDRFGDCARDYQWWAAEGVPLENLRFYLKMLGEHDLGKVQLMTRKTPEKTAPPPIFVPAPRVPLPDATRQTILRLKHELVEKEHYTDLCNTYIRAFVNPSKNDYSVTNDWTRVDFADDTALKRFQVYVDRAERLLLHQKIEKAVDDYPIGAWTAFRDMIIAHFGNRAEQYRWWAKEDVTLEDLRFYLELLGQSNLDKVKLMTRQRLEVSPAKDKEQTTVAATPTPVRVPIPEWTRKTILKFIFDPAVEREYIALKNYYMQELCPPELRNGGWADWRVHFIDEKDVANFQARVDQVERYWLIARIQIAIARYPASKYVEFNSMVKKHFGVKARMMEWYTYTNCPLEEMRFYLEMLGEHNLNKVKLMIEPTILNCVAMFDCAATETKSKAAEPEVPAPAPLTLPERKIRFLRILRDKSILWASLASYMELREPNLCLESIARKVTMTEDEARLSEWEAIVNKTNPEHILWKLLDRKIGSADWSILRGLADVQKDPSDSRSDDERILYFWSTYPEPKRQLICAYLDTLPEKPKK